MNEAGDSLISGQADAVGSRPDGWNALTRFTAARIALGRSGGSWRTPTLLNFRLAHALARDAVTKQFAAAGLEAQIHAAGYETVRLTTQASDSATYLKRPDLGRQLSEDSRRLLRQGQAAWGHRDLAVIGSDGLSALAAERQICPTITHLLPRLFQAGWAVFPIFIVPFARVKIQDEIGELLGVRQAVVLLGERPGLGAHDSLGAYATFHPGSQKTDADRNCISNIRPQGLPPAEAGSKLAELLLRSASQQTSGVALKESGAAVPALP